MNVIPTALPEVLLIEPKVFGDARGFFMESWNEERFNKALGYDVHFVQDNHSRSSRGVLRGLHYQLHPHAQGKLVRCVAGAVFDVAVDMRRSSPNFGRWVGFELSAENQRQLWIPPGFAHGFVVVSESADFLYKTSGRYAPEFEGAVRWDDPSIAVAWPLDGITPQLSGKDIAAPCLSEAKTFD
ncbi:dTDP-4-dehydrorhamnose 3,5-epimerase [Pelomonas sp. Root1217]|uniref:dTDP-4-dehydrorhamnose 3,5-epimerase n=1 Tax=Pelomonas sp. Root1217 TaxID=1736430 RepID=UPI000708A151|nr:dTDP-4-dehydrorhamnose 3,5-epimerase [Pelomonas sp. Root1217]KQV46918.1 dTDP-4-dehydrorhamnose 3,5-epimerase [Pelomonas sp. Root1217]